MNRSAPAAYEQKAEAAFDRQSAGFDQLYSHDTITSYKRERVRGHLNRWLKPASRILELNAGTGEDAIYFASLGHRVHATDISSGMQNVLKGKVKSTNFEASVTTERCSFTMLNNLQDKGPYDAIFSNFAGLNCTGQLAKVLHSFSPLLKPGGTVTLVLLPKLCLWESSLFLAGKFKTAFRRFFSSRGRKAQIEGENFLCWYYNPSFIKRQLKADFQLLEIEGLCTIVPPSYIQGFAEKYPRSYTFLRKLEEKLRYKWPWRSVGDYYIISLRKKP